MPFTPDKNLVYPQDIVNPGMDTDNLFIQVVEYQPPGVNVSSSNFVNRRNTSARETTLGTITLPIPENIADRNAVTWDSDSINSLQLAGLDLVNNAASAFKFEDGKSVGDALSQAGSSVNETIQKFNGAIEDPTIQNALKNALAGRVVNVFGGNISADSLIARTSGQVLNPNLELLFKGVILRDFNFTFTLTPRNFGESQQIKGIINTFKRRMAAKSTASNAGGEGLFIKSPDVFKMKFRRGEEDHPFLFDMKCCALKDMTVNYAGTGVYSTYDDATPVAMNLTLSFRELEPVYNEDYNTDASDGVGF